MKRHPVFGPEPTLHETVDELVLTTEALTRALQRDAALREMTLFTLALSVTALMLAFALMIVVVLA